MKLNMRIAAFSIQVHFKNFIISKIKLKNYYFCEKKNERHCSISVQSSETLKTDGKHDERL